MGRPNIATRASSGHGSALTMADFDRMVNTQRDQAEQDRTGIHDSGSVGSFDIR
jgi:hypothetical protein